jgi:DNA-binding NarL/FixJ family response regulator
VNTPVRAESPAREADATRSSALRVLLVDDHPVVRRGLRQLLTDAFAGAVVHEVGSGREAVTTLLSHVWNVMVLDL